MSSPISPSPIFPLVVLLFSPSHRLEFLWGWQFTIAFSIVFTIAGLCVADAIPPDAQGEAAAKRIDLQQRHDFTARNFEEIQRTIRYACQTPVELDARLGAWARALQEAASE